MISEPDDRFQDQPVQADSLAASEVIANRYRIKRLIGRGGMGEVYEAYDQLLRENVALKTLRNDLANSTPTAVRFQREIQLARKVTHPNVCRIFEVGVHESSDHSHARLPFFSMELLEGETLARRIRRKGRLSRTEAFPIAVQMAEGLQAAHDAGIIHTDFKSGNVILVSAAGAERAVITDFGLARLDPAAAPPEETLTMSVPGHVVGTLAYMSPEQLKGGPVRPSSDIYSFGIVLYEMATGELPFDSRHVIQSAMQRASGDSVDVRSLVPKIDARWESAIVRCLHKDPERRFRSAGDLARWLRGGEWRIAVRYWTRRDWIRAAAAVGAPLAITAGIWTRATRPYRPTPAAVEWYRKGVAALHSMTYEAARRLLDRAVATDSNFAVAHASLAWAYDELDYSDLAKESMLRAVIAAQDVRLSDADDKRIHALQALVSHSYDRAVPLFQNLEKTAADPDLPASALESGWLAERMEDTAAATAAYERALRLDPAYAAAKLRLGYMLGRRGQKGDLAAALAAFADAEKLYAASNDYEGITESLWQRANLLNRRSRAGEATPFIERALSIARAMNNRYQEIRLLQLQGAAVRNLGDTQRAGELAQQAVDAAIADKMDNLATAGLIDLGNSYLVGGDLKSAEAVFRRSLELARRSKIRRFEARALASLGSLCEQDHRPKEAKQFVDAALQFYRQAGYRRELIQTRLILGSIHEQLGEYDDGARVVQEALPDALQLQDTQIQALARERLGDNLSGSGDWPKALQEYERAAPLFEPPSRGGYLRVKTAQLYWRIGRREDAERLLPVAREFAEKDQNEVLRSLLTVQRAEAFYVEGRSQKAIEEARQGLAAIGHDDVTGARLKLIESAVLIRTGKVMAGSQLAESAIAKLEQTLVGYAAGGRLLIAEAFWGGAVRAQSARLALEALQFFEPRRVWESTWRCHGVAALAAEDRAGAEEHRSAARSALDQLRNAWPAPYVDGYLRGPDVKRLVNALHL